MKAVQGDYECPQRSEVERADRERKWFLGVGIVTIIFGLVVGSIPALTGLGAELLLGSLLFVSGVLQIIQTLRTHRGREESVHFVMSLLYIVAGIFMILDPFLGAESVVILMSAFLVAGGVFRILASATSPYQTKGWILFNGIVSLVLGFLILEGWPFTGLWVIGLFAAIEMVVYGCALVIFSVSERKEIQQIRLHCGAAV